MNSFNAGAVEALQKNNQLQVLFGSNIGEVQVSNNEKPLVCFEEDHFDDMEFDIVVYALGGSTPENFLKSTGINFVDEAPDLTESGESTTPGLFIIGDLLAGKKGGSIAHAFNASKATMEKIYNSYLK